MSVESPKLPALVTIRYVIMSLLNRIEDYSLKQYKRLTQIAIEGIAEELSIFHSPVAGNEVVYLHMSAAKTVQLPADFIDYLRVGFPVNGKLRVITKHDNLLLPRTFYGSMVNGVFVPDSGDVIGNNTLTEEGLTNAIYFSDHWRNGNLISGLYGLPGGVDTAYYRFDMETRQIIFSGSTPRSEIVLEYISSGLKTDGSSLISRELVAPLRNYVLWQKDINNQRIALNLKEMAKREFEESVEALRTLKLSFTYDEYMREIYSTASQAPKR